MSRLFGLYLTTTNKSVTQAANTRSRYIVGKAYDKTPKANPATIQSQLLEPRQGGKTLGQLIIETRARKNGKPVPSKKAAMNRAVKRMIGARKRSVGFIKSGWIPAFQQLGTSIGKAGVPRGGKKVKQGKDKGYARPARENKGRPIDAEVVFVNQVKAARGVGLRALVDSFRDESASLKGHLEKKLQQDLSHIRI